MSFNKLAGIYVYCMDYHTGQWSRLYRLMCKIDAHLNDSAIRAIQGENPSEDLSEEWYEARQVYNSLVERKAQ